MMLLFWGFIKEFIASSFYPRLLNPRQSFSPGSIIPGNRPIHHQFLVKTSQLILAEAIPHDPGSNRITITCVSNTATLSAYICQSPFDP
jgi:hypothetical protein